MATERQPVLSWLRSWTVAVVLTLFLLTAVGASGVFAFVLCPQCGSVYVPQQQTPPLPTTLEADKKDDK